MKSSPTLINKMRQRVEKVAFGNPLYQKILDSGESPEHLYFTLPDMWPGDADKGMAQMAAEPSMFHDESGVPEKPSELLRNLRAVGSEKARRYALDIILEGVLDCEEWNVEEWTSSLLGERIIAWIGFYEFYAQSVSKEIAYQITESLYRQWKHLVRVHPTTLTSIEGLTVIQGLILGGLNFPEGDRALGLACDYFRRLMAADILPDGMHISRNPSVHFQVLKKLVEIRALFVAAGLPFPDEARLAISSMIPVLKFFRTGDGGLSLFQGGCEESNLMLDMVLQYSEIRGRTPRRLTSGHYERLSAGRSLLIADCGMPAPCGHAGLLAFEFSQGRERLIVNCGATPNGSEDWRRAMAATAAHTTLSLEDINACDLTFRSRHVSNCQSHRYEQAGAQGLEMRSDGYFSRFKMIHQRILELSEDGDELRGCDILEGLEEVSYTLRWHLHPSVQVSLSQSGQMALLRTPSGSGWSLRVPSASLAIEPSIYCGSGEPRRSLHIKWVGRTVGQRTPLFWKLVREKK